MYRPKSAGGSRSFLDDLLGNDVDSNAVSPSSSATLASQRQRKSVRFFDEDDDDNNNDPIGTKSVNNNNNRPHSSTLDSLLSSTTPRTRQGDSALTSSTATSAKSDWLGLEDDNNEIGVQLTRKPTSAPATSRSTVSISQLQSQIASPKTSSEPDWLTSGLKARQQTTPTQQQQQQQPWQPKLVDSSNQQQSSPTSVPEIAISNIGTNANFSQTNPTVVVVPDSLTRIRDDDSTSQVSFHSQPTVFVVDEQQQQLEQPKIESESQIVEQIAAKLPEIVQTQFKVDSNSTVYLQTQLRMMTLEKSFLDKTIEQMKCNHQEELNSMVSLYEQQMRLTSEMYKRHEEMIQEERERRISELNGQLEHVEKEMDAMRSRFQERLTTVENDWKSDVVKLRDSNSSATRRLIEEHEQEMARLEHRLRTENDESVQTNSDLVQRQGKTIAELLARWEQSAHKIEQLQRSVIVRQEELTRQQQLSNQSELQDDLISRKFSDIETQWKTFVNEMEQQRTQFVDVIRSEKDKNEEQISMKIEQQRKQIESEQKELEMVRQQFAAEVNQWRQQESQEAERMRKERDKLREDVLIFEERRSMLETLYSERNKMIQEEQTRAAKQSDQIVQRQTELDQQQSEVKKKLLTLESEQQLLEHKKQQFHQEKEQLNQLGQTLSRRAEELEKLSEVALKEKMDGIQAIDEIDSFRAEIQSKIASIETSTAQMRKEEKRLAIERAQLEQQWMMVRELKESIVCNLCGTALNRAKYPPASANYSVAMFSNQVNNYGSNPMTSGNDNLRSANSSSPLFYGLLNGNQQYLMRQNNNNVAGMRSGANQLLNNSTNDIRLAEAGDDQNLLFWQLTGQKDAASLNEETNFVRMLTKSQQLMNRVSSMKQSASSSIPFQ